MAGWDMSSWRGQKPSHESDVSLKRRNCITADSESRRAISMNANENVMSDVFLLPSIIPSCA